MLEQYFRKPSTVDRIRANWLASRHDRQIGPMLGPLRTYGHCKGEMVASFGACKERVT
jgi:hypothetical protein